MSGYKTQAQIQEAERQVVGPYIVGGVLQAIVYGILLAQYGWIIVKARHRPSLKMHAFLGTLALLNTAQCAGDIALLWQVIMDFASHAVTRRTYSPPVTVVIIVLYCIIQCMNACFFGRRCFIATGRTIWIALLLAIVVGSLIVASSAVCVLNVLVFTRGESYIVIRKWLAAAICCNAVAEVVISVILVQRITRDELIRYRAIVNRIVGLSLTTASLTAVIGVAQAIVLLTTWQRSSAYVALGFVLPRLSTISVYASVMSRDSLQKRLLQHEAGCIAPEACAVVSHCSTDKTLTVQCPQDVYKGSHTYHRRPSLDTRRLPSFAELEPKLPAPQ